MRELGNFLDGEGRLKQVPAKQRMKFLALSYLAGKFEADHEYTETQVNELLYAWHTFRDPATLRRELYNYHFLHRTDDGRRYWLADEQPRVEDFL